MVTKNQHIQATKWKNKLENFAKERFLIVSEIMITKIIYDFMWVMTNIYHLIPPKDC